MRKLILSIMGLTFATMVSAQNIQLHYDFGRNIYTGEEAGRSKVTVTLEQFLRLTNGVRGTISWMLT